MWYHYYRDTQNKPTLRIAKIHHVLLTTYHMIASPGGRESRLLATSYMITPLTYKLAMDTLRIQKYLSIKPEKWTPHRPYLHQLQQIKLAKQLIAYLYTIHTTYIRSGTPVKSTSTLRISRWKRWSLWQASILGHRMPCNLYTQLPVSFY